MVMEFGLSDDSDWFAVNDTVMGGVSQGEVTYTQDFLSFEGVVSTDSNGGFTSVRSPSEERNLEDFDRVLVRMRSEGQPFSLNLADSLFWFEGQFRFDIETTGTDWEIVEIPFEEFEYYAFNGGYPTGTGEMMGAGDRETIFHIEMMSELFQDGSFLLEIDWLAFD